MFDKINELVEAYNALAAIKPVKVHSATFSKCACGKCTTQVEASIYTYPYCVQCYGICG